MTDLQPTCAAVNRPQQLFDAATTVHGLRSARTTVVAGQRVVGVWLFRPPPASLANPTLWSLVAAPGGAEVDIGAAAIAGDHIDLTVVGTPDPTPYRLELSPPPALDVDPLRLRIPVRLRPECPDLGSCFPPEPVPTQCGRSPVDDYTARDWTALRQTLLDFHQRQRPDADTSDADPAVILIELFAHVGDVLNYRLDRVATEAYLATARQRTSVRRHARLLDYPVGQPVAARTRVHVSVAPGGGTVNVPAGVRVHPEADTDLSFVLEDALPAIDALGEIAVYDWGETGCRLEAGATSATLVRPIPADGIGPNWLAVGDRVVLEVVDLGDPAIHRRWRQRDPGVPWPQVDGVDAFRLPLPSRTAHVVELTAVAPITDPLAPTLPLVVVTWGAADQLPRCYPISPDSTRGAPEVTVARGNLADAHHGNLVSGPADQTLAPLVADWAEHLPADEVGGDGPTGHLLVAAGDDSLSRREDGTPYLLDVDVTFATGEHIEPSYVDTHLGVPTGQLAITVEEEEWRPPLLRFRTGDQGTDPPSGSVVTAGYEVGGGARGNVSANTLTVLEANVAPPNQPPQWQAVVGPVLARNPVAADGGADAEELARVRRGAPQAFAAFPRRAVTPADHAAAVLDVAGIDRASASREWTGAWPRIRTVVDVLGSEVTADLAAATEHLEGLRMIGQEVVVVTGSGVGLVIGLDVCLSAGTDTEGARRAILARLRPGTDDAPGLFHPDNLRLGGTLHVSAVVAAAAAVPGVDAVEVSTARRLAEPEGTVHEVLHFGRDEIPVLDDDPSRPNRGRLELTLRGGR